MKLKKLLKTYNADRYYHLYVFKGANALVSDLEIENNDFERGLTPSEDIRTELSNPDAVTVK